MMKTIFIALRNMLRSSGRRGVTRLHLWWLSLVVSQRFLVWRIHLWRHPATYKESIPLRMKQTLFIIRHGQTSWNLEHRLPGQLAGVHLTEEGQQQARRLAEALVELPLTTIVSSPLERAQETAQYLLPERNLELQFEPDLMDTDVGPWSGQKIEDLAKNDPAWKAYVQIRW